MFWVFQMKNFTLKINLINEQSVTYTFKCSDKKRRV